MTTYRWGWIAAAGLVALIMVPAPSLAELPEGNCKGETVPEGTVLNKTNIDDLKNKCLDGWRIGDILPERVEWQVRGHNMFLRLYKHDDVKIPYRRRMNTEKYKGQARIVEPYDLAGWTAGIPFPDVTPDDPQVAIKVIWNHVRGSAMGDNWCVIGGSVFDSNFVYALIDANQGIERVQEWTFSRVWYTGRDDGRVLPETGEIFIKGLLFAVAPQDVKGLGTLAIRYVSPKLDDVWAYIRSVRRVRRLSGGAWVDPIGGTDQLQDDIWFNAHPAWYKEYKLLGKQVTLWSWETEILRGGKPRYAYNPAGGTLQERFPYQVLSEPPYWNFDAPWQPRMSWIIETIPPEYHPYSKKIVYLDADTYAWNGGYVYDKKGDIWKALNFSIGLRYTEDGVIDPDTGKPEITITLGSPGGVVDFQRRHATMINLAPNFGFNCPSLAPTDITLANLERAGR